MKNTTLTRILAVLIVYVTLRFFGGSFGEKVLYPINLLVTFLHEFGHALGALITGGKVLDLQINMNGSGFTRTQGGSMAIILMGGYIGSAILGNILFYIGARLPRFSSITLNVLAFAMMFSGIMWFNSLFTTGFLILFGLALFFIANKTAFDQEVLMFLGLATIIYIIQDFNVGPTSDLERYAELFVIVPTSWWMYIWLVIVLLLFVFNIRLIFKGIATKEVQSYDSTPLDQ